MTELTQFNTFAKFYLLLCCGRNTVIVTVNFIVIINTKYIIQQCFIKYMIMWVIGRREEQTLSKKEQRNISFNLLYRHNLFMCMQYAVTLYRLP